MPIRFAMSATISRQQRLAEMYMELWALNQLIATTVPTREQAEAMTEGQIKAVRREAVVLQRAFKDLL